MHVNQVFLMVGVSYALIANAPVGLKMGDWGTWFHHETQIVEPLDKSVLNPNYFYQNAPMQSNEQLFVLYQRQAQQGDAQAQHKLGLAYEYGLGVHKNHAQALFWYQQSAENGYKRSQLRLGYAYWDGALGLSNNALKAQDWFERAGVSEGKPVRLSQMH